MAYETVTLANTQQIAVDNIGGGVLIPVTKLDYGGDSASIPASGDAANGLDVDVTRVGGTVTVAWIGAPTVSVSGSVGVSSLPASVTGGGRTLQWTPIAYGGGTTPAAIVAAQGGSLKIKVYGIILNVAHATADSDFRILNGTSDLVGSASQPMKISAKSGFVAMGDAESPFWVTGANQPLNLASTASVGLSGGVAWFAEA